MLAARLGAPVTEQTQSQEHAPESIARVLSVSVHPFTEQTQSPAEGCESVRSTVSSRCTRHRANTLFAVEVSDQALSERSR